MRPHETEHADHAPQFVTAQCTGEGVVVVVGGARVVVPPPPRILAYIAGLWLRLHAFTFDENVMDVASLGKRKNV